MKITYYLEVISSWCHWAEPAWAELKQRYAGPVEFGWKLALMDASGCRLRAHNASGFTGAAEPYELADDAEPGWFEPELKEYLAPNLIAEAARDFGVTDDRGRLAIARAAVIDGRKMGRWEEAAVRGRHGGRPGRDSAVEEGEIT